MKVVKNGDEQKILVTFYTEVDFKGERRDMTAGQFNKDQFDLKDYKSAEVAEGSVMVIRGDPEGVAQFSGKLSDITEVGFEPRSLTISPGTELLSDEQLDGIAGGVSCGKQSCERQYCHEFMTCSTEICVGFAQVGDGTQVSLDF